MLGLLQNIFLSPVFFISFFLVVFIVSTLNRYIQKTFSHVNTACISCHFLMLNEQHKWENKVLLNFSYMKALNMH